MAKQLTLKTIAANLIGHADRLCELQIESRNMSKTIAGRITASGMTRADRKSDAAKEFSAKLVKAVEEAAETAQVKPDVLVKAKAVLKTQLMYAWNIVCGVGDEGGRTLKTKTGAKAGKIEKPEKEAAQTKHVVTRDGALSFIEAAIGKEGAFCIEYILDNPHMIAKLITMTKFDFESVSRDLKIAA